MHKMRSLTVEDISPGCVRLRNRVYMINISLGTINFDLFTYGNLLYFSQGEYHTQIAMSIYDNKRFTRMSSNGGNSWGEWREF